MNFWGIILIQVLLLFVGFFVFRIVASTNQKLQTSLKDLSLLYHSLNVLSRPLEQSELLHTITRLLPEVVKLKKFSLLLLNEAKDRLEVQATYGFQDTPQVLTLSIPPGKGVIGEVIRGRKLAYLPQIQDGKDLFHAGEKGEIGSFLSIPLLVAEELIGVLSVAHEEREAYSLSDIRLVESIGSQIALAYDRSKLYMKTKELSVRDELTGLYNRRHFQEMLRMEWKRSLRFGRPLALLMVDVDHFKNFNDRYGHLQGDHALKMIAKLLLENVREVDTVARFGGEEFVILLADTALSEAMFVAEKLRQVVEENRLALSPSSPSVFLSASIGVSAYPDTVSNEEELISTADIALYEAKATGRNRVKAYHASLRSNRVSSHPFEAINPSARIAS